MLFFMIEFVDFIEATGILQVRSLSSNTEQAIRSCRSAGWLQSERNSS